mmetsp:Transcript_60658/g.168144  ORF Transcript_60658/g.168144 Transcript_60658/m.168144 type:complete len:203 (-) Transcript_60658:357-965(-)
MTMEKAFIMAITGAKTKLKPASTMPTTTRETMQLVVGLSLLITVAEMQTVPANMRRTRPHTSRCSQKRRRTSAASSGLTERSSMCPRRTGNTEAAAGKAEVMYKALGPKKLMAMPLPTTPQSAPASQPIQAKVKRSRPLLGDRLIWAFSVNLACTQTSHQTTCSVIRKPQSTNGARARCGRNPTMTKAGTPKADASTMYGAL